MSKQPTQPTQPTQPPTSGQSGTQKPSQIIDSIEVDSKKKLLISGLSLVMMIGIPAVAVYDGFTVTSLILPKAPALLFALGTKSMGLLANYKLESGEYVTSKQREIGNTVYWLSVCMAGFAIALVAVKALLPMWAILVATAIITSSTFISMGLVHKADSLNPEQAAILLQREEAHKAKMLRIEKQAELAKIQNETHYNNLIAEQTQRALISQTDNNIVNNALAMKLAESEIQLAQSQRMKADALKLIESKGEKGNKVKEKSLTAIYAQIEEHTKSDEGKREMAEMAKLFFRATIEDVGNTLLPSSIDVAPPTLQAINTSSTAQQVPAIINNRLPNSPRKCENPSCGKPIPASSHKSKKYCGNSCKTQASKARNTP